MEEPTDEMLEAIMLGVQEHARQSTIKAKAELDRRFNEMVEQMQQYKALRVQRTWLDERNMLDFVSTDEEQSGIR